MKYLMAAMVAVLAASFAFPSFASACKAGETRTKNGKTQTCRCVVLENGATVCGYSQN